ncbi:MAG: putative two-component system sensor kinase, partial [Acidimicrobiaceae bacterium]|nr:putative two-component system sensor kinase [Acidimicrobiaceae bacterium]
RELRSILDVLRQVDEDEPAVPLPDGDAFQALADATSAAGVATRLRWEANLVGASPGAALGAYRIVQESLTNVIRHARDSTAEVTISARGEMLVVDVVNDGPSGQDRFVDGAGSGLLGMKERARILGGVLRAGPREQGGFGVHAELPLTLAVSDPDSSGPTELLAT